MLLDDNIAVFATTELKKYLEIMMCGKINVNIEEGIYKREECCLAFCNKKIIRIGILNHTDVLQDIIKLYNEIAKIYK